jgi:hypothetical protein
LRLFIEVCELLGRDFFLVACFRDYERSEYAVFWNRHLRGRDCMLRVKVFGIYWTWRVLMDQCVGFLVVL